MVVVSRWSKRALERRTTLVKVRIPRPSSPSVIGVSVWDRWTLGPAEGWHQTQEDGQSRCNPHGQGSQISPLRNPHPTKLRLGMFYRSSHIPEAAGPLRVLDLALTVSSLYLRSDHLGDSGLTCPCDLIVDHFFCVIEAVAEWHRIPRLLETHSRFQIGLDE